MKNKLYDCITFFDNNFMFDLRYNILKDVVDCFVICESKYDHRNQKKKINFDNKHTYDQSKILHLVLEKPFPKENNIWQNQAFQRDFLLQELDYLSDEDYIFFSDPDEIPDPSILKNFSLKKNMASFFRDFLIINLTFLINMKLLGRELEFVKRKI